MNDRFLTVADKLNANFQKHIASRGDLLEVEVDKDILWNKYLESFPEGANPIYLVNREHDCSCCRHFIKAIGGTVYIDSGLNVHSIFEFDAGDEDYQPSMDALDAYVKSCKIRGLFLYRDDEVGYALTRDRVGLTVKTFHHFHVTLPDGLFCDKGKIETEKAKFRDTRNVFKRSLDEISMEAIDTVRELILSNTLYRGTEWLTAIEKFRENKQFYDTLTDEKKEIFCWQMAAAVGNIVGRIRNHSIGTLLIDVTEGMELDEAVRRYEAIVAPANYKRPKAIFTKKMLEEAQKTVQDLGYMDALPRRFATMDDITAGNILFINRDAAKRISGNVFDEMMADTAVNPKQFSRVEEIAVDKFISDVLPVAKEVEVFMEGRHSRNLVSLIAPVNKDAKPMFKWGNGFSWAYAGNMADSDIKENVKNAGGRVDGVLRFSIQWNDGGEWDTNDLDAHCIIPKYSEEICYHDKISRITGGNLDVDIIHTQLGKAAVENITFPDKRRMRPGAYNFFVHCYSNRGGKSGFRAEIEFDGNIYQYDYSKPLRQGERVGVATVTMAEDGTFSISESLNSTAASREEWGIKTNQFIPVSMIMYSPNYWDEQQGNGNRHYLFMLKGCKNPEAPNGFYNEYLKNELLEHKRVFEALGAKMAVEPSDDQLSGLGFSSTRRNDLVVKVKGATERTFKIKF